MTSGQQRKPGTSEKGRSGKSPVPPSTSSAPVPVTVPAPAPAPTPAPAAVVRAKGYKSDGVKDNDIFLLPASDFQILIAVTVVAAVVRLFRIYQPTSVVFDEVQYVYYGP